MRLLRRTLLGVLCVSPALALGACYGATELRIELTTDVPCGEGPTTAVYKGGRHGEGKVRYDEGAVAETSRCVAGEGDGEIGSLVFVPRGARNAEAAVKVVLATEGESVEDCARDPAGKACIVATRSFSFVQHAALRLPITLPTSCRGVVCAEGETCVMGGRCVDDRVVCEGDDCAPPGEREDPGGGGRDGGPPDGGPPDGGPRADGGDPPPSAVTCETGKGVVDLAVAGSEPWLFAAGSEELFYVEEGALGTLKAVGKRPSSGGPRDAFSLPGVPSADAPVAIRALAVRGTSWAVATAEHVHYRMAGASSPTAVPLAGVTSLALSPSGGLYGAVAGSVGTIRRIDTTAADGMLLGIGPIATDADAIYFLRRQPAGTHSIVASRLDTGSEGTLFEASSETVLFSSFGDRAFAYATPSDRPAGFYELAPSGEPQPLRVAVFGVQAFAARPDALFWSQAAAEEQPLFAARPPWSDGAIEVERGVLPSLAVDERCVYYWTATSAGAQLRSAPTEGLW